MIPNSGRAIDVRAPTLLAKVTRGMAAISGRNALYRHLRSIQSSNRPMKPPNKMHAAKVRGAEMPFMFSTPKKYRRKM